MALTATATQGFEYAGQTTGDEVFYLPGNPGTTYTRGDQVGIGGAVSESSPTAGLEGVLKQLATADVNPIGTVLKTTVCPAASVAFPRPSRVDPVYDSASYSGVQTSCLVPVRINVPAGEKIWHATFANQVDDTVISYTASTHDINCHI